MEQQVFTILKKIRDIYGPGEFGKISQKLLAIVLSRLCFEVKERSVQDIDIEAVRNTLKFWIEVKTSDKDVVTIQEKDVEGLNQCELLHGGVTGYAVLKVSLLSNWVIASSRNIRAGTVRIGSLGTQIISPLNDDVNRVFPSVVIEFGDKILCAGKGRAQFVADRLLKEEITRKKSSKVD